jgi:peroxiredoxin Q/BCP
MTALAPGQPVPPFSAASTGGEIFSSDTFRGGWTVLYFYPKDNTPGCTQEAQDFNSLKGEFEAANARVVGISRDSLKSHDNFQCKYGLGFPLLSDPDETLCSLFDVIRMKNMYGKQVRGIERSTFLIDPDGCLAREWRKVSVKGHAADVLATLKQLQA